MLYGSEGVTQVVVATVTDADCSLHGFSATGAATWVRTWLGESCTTPARGAHTAMLVLNSDDGATLLAVSEIDGSDVAEIALPGSVTAGPVRAPSTDLQSNGGSHWIVGAGDQVVEVSLKNGVVSSVDLGGAADRLRTLDSGVVLAVRRADDQPVGVADATIHRLQMTSAGLAVAGAAIDAPGLIVAGPVIAAPCDGDTWWCESGVILAAGAEWVAAWNATSGALIETAALPSQLLSTLTLGADGRAYAGGHHWSEAGDASSQLGAWTPDKQWELLAEFTSDGRVFGSILGTGDRLFAAQSADDASPSVLLTTASTTDRLARGWARRLGNAGNAGPTQFVEGVCVGSESHVWAVIPPVLGTGDMEAVVALPDGGAVAAGELGLEGEYDLAVVRFDPQGNVLWQHSYGTGGYDEVSALLFVDGQVIIAGQSPVADWSGDAVVYWLDDSGNVTHSQLYGGTGKDEFEAAYARPAGFAFAGRTKIESDEQAWLVLTDSAGNVENEWTFGDAEKNDRVDGVAALAESWILAGQSNTKLFQSQGKIWRLAADGQVEWELAAGGVFNDELLDVVVTDAGIIIAVGKTTPSPAGAYGWVVRASADGTLLSEHQLEIAGARAVVPGPGGWFDVVGRGPDTQRLSAEGIATAGAATVLEGTVGAAAARASDGGLLIVGQTYQGIISVPIVIKTDAWGAGSCTLAGSCVNVAAGACDDDNPCTTDGCDNETGACVNSAVADGTECSGGGTCNAAQCQ